MAPPPPEAAAVVAARCGASSVAAFSASAASALALDALLEPLAGHGVQAERLEHLAEHVIRRGVAELELLDVRGRISFSTNWRTASRTITCSSLHSNIAPPQLPADLARRGSNFAYGAKSRAAAAPINSTSVTLV